MYKPARWLLLVLAISLYLSSSACVFVRSSSISESSGPGSPIQTEFDDFGFLHLTAPSALTASANAALLKQCQSGMMSNVQTELSMREWFLIVQYYTVTAAAVCK
jgi:hypothetical protein